MRSAALLSATLAFGNLAVGQEAVSSTVVTLIIPMLSGAKTILGSVVSTAGPDATAYRLVCPSNTPAASCGLGSGMDMLQGPSTASWNLKLEQPSGFTADSDCKISKETAVCKGGFGEGGSITTTTSITMTGLSSYMTAVTLTAGLEKLQTGVAPGFTTSTVTSKTGTRLHDFDCHFQDWRPASRLRLSLPRLTPPPQPGELPRPRVRAQLVSRGSLSRLYSLVLRLLQAAP